MLSLRGVGGTAALLLACGCGAGGPHDEARRVDVARRVLVITAADGEVCATSSSAARSPSPVCLAVVDSGEPVVSATLAGLDAATDLVMVLARPDVAVHGLGAGTTWAIVPSAGRELVVWLRMLPTGSGVVCASYRAPDGHGRLVVHRAVSAAEDVAVEKELDDGC